MRQCSHMKHWQRRWISVEKQETLLHPAPSKDPDKHSWRASEQSATSLERTFGSSPRSPTANRGVLVPTDDALGSLGGMQEVLPGQGAAVAELRVVVQQHQTAADAAQRTQSERLDVQVLDGQWENPPSERTKQLMSEGKFSGKKQVM